MRFVLVTGARPNFMKAAPLVRAAARREIELLLVHTGQHYDFGMSQVFFEELGLPPPHRFLGVGSGSHAEVTGRCLIELEQVFIQEKPDFVIVVGDVNSTLAAALAAAKLHIPVAHVEAGLRSFDRSMPEEVNRLATDAISDLLLVSEPSGVTNLRREGHPEQAIHLVGNVMIDTLEQFREAAGKRHFARSLGLEERFYALMTLHRPSNVDRIEDLQSLINTLRAITARLPVLFPVHPRTRTQLEAQGLWLALTSLPGLTVTAPVGYLDFLSATMTARAVLTDSGGIQEETTVLGIPCLTLRDNTERPITVEQGTNRLVGARGERLLPALDEILGSPAPTPKRPLLWDGQSADRILQILCDEMRRPRQSQTAFCQAR